MRAIRRELGRLRAEWRRGLRRLPFFTQRTAVLLVGVLVAALAMLGGAVALVGWPGADGPTHLVPGGQAGPPPTTHPRPGAGAAPAGPGGGAASPGPGAGTRATPGAEAASGTPAPGASPGSGSAADPDGARAGLSTGPATAAGTGGQPARPGGAQGSGGAAGAGAGGPSAAPPTTTTLAPGRPLDPVEELLGPVVSTLLP